MNRVVLITGASSGIGAATARALAGRARLILAGRRRDALDTVAAAITASGGEALAVPGDLTADGMPARLVQAAVTRFGGLDAVVNNAGIFETAAIGAVDTEHLHRQWQINVAAPMLLVQAALPHLRGRRGGTIINLGSVAADAAFAGCGAYAGTKAALAAWTRCLREELRGTNVRVSLVVAGATATEIWPPSFADRRDRMCRPEDVAQAIRAILETPATASIDRIDVTPPGGPL
jgi:NADP-dependent 3-hydroxy acid dehydrogenase YdfG